MDWKNGTRAALFLALLATPALHPWLPLPEPRPLAGAETEPERPPAGGLRPWLDGSRQGHLERRLDRGLRMRPWLVRTHNQLRLTLFGQVRPGGTPIVRGRENWLFEKAYLDRYNRSVRLAESRLRGEVERLRRLDALLAARGTTLVVLIAPSKAEVYPDYLPEDWIRPGRERRRTAYDLIAPLLAAPGLAVVDGHRILLERRRSSPVPLFPRGGTHWSHYGAALVVEQLLRAVDRRGPGRFVLAEVTGHRVDDAVWGTDADLARLLNLWHEKPFVGPQVHPVVRVVREDRRVPKVLFVGDSFSLTPLRIMTEEGLAEPGDTLYYFRRRISFPGGGSEPIDPASFDVARALEGIDVLVVETGEYYLPDIGFGFVEAALAALGDAARG